MQKKVICSSCGGEVEENLPKCPYCGSLNYKGAEQEYLNKLENVRENMEDLQEVPREETIKAIRLHSKRIRKILLAVFVAGAILSVMFWFLMNKDERNPKADLLWKQENYPIMGEMYESGEYDKLYAFFRNAIEEDAPVWEWEHNGFCEVYGYAEEVREEQEEENAEWKATSYRLLFHDEWVLIGIPFREDLTEEEKQYFAVDTEKAAEDVRNRFDMTDEEYNFFYKMAEQNQGRVDFIKCEEYVDKWYKTREGHQ